MTIRYLSMNIKYLREKKNLTQSKLESLLGLKRGNLYAYESGKNVPHLSTLVEIADMFQVSIDDLVNKKLNTTASIHVSEERPIPYLTKQDLYNIHALVEKVHELDAIVRKLEKLLG